MNDPPRPREYTRNRDDPYAPLGSKENPFPDRSSVNVIMALRALSIEVRENTRDQCHEYSHAGGHWTRLDDSYVDLLRDTIGVSYWVRSNTTGRKLRMRLTHDEWRMALNAYYAGVATARVDPFLEYLQSNREKWDLVPRMHTVIADTLGADPDCKLTKWASRYLFIAPIVRAILPGAKQDEIPILVGNQGIGKSDLLRSLFATSQEDWFSDDVRLSSETKDRVESMQGKVIIEIAEMVGSRKADIEDMKAFLTRRVDTVRLAYRRDPSRLPRKCSFIGTSDNDQFLPNDAAGLRRFVPIKCTRGSNVKAYFDKSISPGVTLRDSLWAEAYCDVTTGFCQNARLPRDLYDTQRDTVDQFRNGDSSMEDKIMDLNITAGDHLSIQQIAELMHLTTAKIPCERGQSMRIANALRVTGHEKVRVGNRNYWTKSSD